MASSYERCNGIAHATHDDSSSSFGPEATARLNEVLESVNRLIESLNSVVDDEQENDVMSVTDDCVTAEKLKARSYLGKCDPLSFEIDKSICESNGINEIHLHTEANDANCKSRSTDVREDKALISKLNGPVQNGSTNNAADVDMNNLVNVNHNITKQSRFPNSSLDNGTKITSLDKFLSTDRVKTLTPMTNEVKYEDDYNECSQKSDENNQQTDRESKQILSSSDQMGKLPAENEKSCEKFDGFISKNSPQPDSQFTKNSIADKDGKGSSEITISENTSSPEELPRLFRSSPTLVRKDRKALENRGLLRKSSSEESSEKSTLVTPSKENNLDKIKKKSNKAVDAIPTLPHRSLSLKKVITRKFGGSRREKRKLIAAKSLPSETKADHRKLSDSETHDTLEILHDKHHLLGCFLGNDEGFKENNSGYQIQEQLKARTNPPEKEQTTKRRTLPRQQNVTFTPPPPVRRTQSVEERPYSLHLTHELSRELESADSACTTPVLRHRNKHLGGGKLNRFFHSFRHQQGNQQENSFDEEDDSEDISKPTTVDRMRYHLQKSSLLSKEEMKSRYSSGSADSYPQKRHSDGYKQSLRKDMFHSDPGNAYFDSNIRFSSGSRVKSMPNKESLTSLEENEQSPRRSTIGSSYVRESSSDVLTRHRRKFLEEKKSENGARNKEGQDVSFGSRAPKPFNFIKSTHSQSTHVKSLHHIKGSKADQTNDKNSGTSFHSGGRSRHDYMAESEKGSSAHKHTLFPRSSKSSNKFATGKSQNDKKTERTWEQTESCVWSNMNGRTVELEQTDLLSLSESECDSLQKVSLQHIHELDLGAQITVPKDESKLLNSKNSVKRKYVHISLSAKNKNKKEDHVFGIPLVRVVENDQLLRLQTIDQPSVTTASLSGSTASVDVASQIKSHVNTTDSIESNQSLSADASPSTQSRSSSTEDLQSSAVFSDLSSSCSVNRLTSEESDVFPRSTSTSNRSQSPSTNSTTPTTPSTGRKAPPSGVGRPLKRRDAIGADSMSEIDQNQSKLLESLMLSVSGHRVKKRSLLPPTMPQVPYVVQKCCAHIIKYGLNLTGIFRVAGSKKRVRQLREEFDRGVDVKIEQDYNPHDVSALLKEFFRDLPEALLTRELYQAFISTRKLKNCDRLAALRCLVWLLPMPNRDTLQQLLSFLSTVSDHAEDRVDQAGNEIPGNKMGITNIATIFGPNILHRNKKSSQSSSDAQYQVQSIERAEESTLVIGVVQEMIENQKTLFTIPRDIHDEMLRTLKESDPDAVDFLLRRKAANMREKSVVPSSTGAEQSPDNDYQSDYDQFEVDPPKVQPEDREEIAEKNSRFLPNDDEADAKKNKDSKWTWRRSPKHAIKQDFTEDPTVSSSQRNVSPRIEDEIQHITSPKSPTPSVVSSVSSLTFSPRSVSFTEDDMNDIFQGDISTMKQIEEETEFAHSTGDKTNDPISPPIPIPRKKRSGGSPGQEISTQVYGEAASQNPRSRRPAFSATSCESQNILATESRCLDAKTNQQEIECARQSARGSMEQYRSISGKTTHPHRGYNPRERRMAVRVQRPNIKNDTSPVRSEQREHSEKDCDEPVEVPPIRKRLPSTLNLRVHRVYGDHVTAPNYIQSRDDSFVDLSNTSFDRERSSPSQSEKSRKLYAQSRRFSKDDMFITLQAFKNRHQERYCKHRREEVGSNSYVHEPPRVQREEIPTPEEIEKWKLWQAVNNNVISAKTERIVPETLV